jgi:plastocyanin
MSTPIIEQPSRPADSPPRSGSWDRLLVISAATVAIVDLVFFALIAEVIPPLAVGVVLTAVGIGIMRIRRTPGIVVLALTTIVMLVGSVPFAIDHLGHPDSGVDWVHALISVVARLFVLGVAVAAWQRRGESGARLAGVIAIGVAGVVATVALVATAVTSGDEREAGDIVVVVDATAFPEQIVVGPGDVLFIDNTHIFRHSFTVEGTDIDVQLPALQGVRIPIDLPVGTYDVICDVPGHDSMTTVLVVE